MTLSRLNIQDTAGGINSLWGRVSEGMTDPEKETIY